MCDCHSNMDIRGRCCPIYYPAAYKKCGARVDTAYFHLTNDCESIRLIEEYKKQKDVEKIIKSFLHHRLKIISKIEKQKIIDYYWKQEEDVWFEIVLPVKKPKTKKVKKVKKVVEEPEEREQFCCCCFVTHDEWYVLGAPDTPMCPCNPDFEGDRDEYYKENDMEDPHTVSRFDFCCGCNKMKDVKYYKEKYELLCDECIV